METLDLGDGRVWSWPVTQTFEIERILDKKMVPCKVGTHGRSVSRASNPRARASNPSPSHLDRADSAAPCSQAKKFTWKDYPQYLILWKEFPPERATWQWPVQRGVTGGVPVGRWPHSWRRARPSGPAR